MPVFSDFRTEGRCLIKMLSIVGIAPHPPIIIPEIGRGEIKKAQKTVDGMKLLGSHMKQKGPELTVIITPHGKVLSEGPAVLADKQLSGNFGQFGFPGIQLEMESDQQLIELLVEESSKEPVKPTLLGNSGQASFGRNNLDHGILVPLYYLQQAGVNTPGMYVGVGFQTYDLLYRFGSILRRAIEKRGLPTAVVASGDLSHRLIPGAPAGYNPRGADFDQQLVEFIRDGRVKDILNLDQQLVEEAGECGLRSIIIALGMLDHNFRPEIISYEGPFGVGYLVAALHPENS